MSGLYEAIEMLNLDPFIAALFEPNLGHVGYKGIFVIKLVKDDRMKRAPTIW